ncbi:hypothetical protein WR25_18851 [Diploscapter pachys]|uniref:Ammonium transporter AmtB-like domain-containing protein n=1 Tax=Diploscapter pachys TaxID=2018661 RepID=A0A2A2KAI7_9BILA|nr:hypothetical protein WR25_18851 [Diploscapter pachys]
MSMNFCFGISQQFLFKVSSFRLEMAVEISGDRRNENSIDCLTNCDGAMEMEEERKVFQDVHLMIFVGFGFLMAFLKRYGFSAVSVNLLLSSFVVQYSMVLRGFLSKKFHDTGFFTIGIPEMISADSSCAVVLITMGVLLGRVTPSQFILLAFFETSMSVLVEHIVFNILHVNDGGRSLVVHAFGAYFGLAASIVGQKRNVMEMDEEGRYHHSDLFSMIGTLLLWVFFPSFNAAIQEPEDARHRAIMNTYLAMASSTVTTFLVSSLVDRLGRFNMIHIQSSTLAGGVAIGSSANAVLYPAHALLVGVLAGLISVLGHAFLSPILERHFKLYDTCGVHNLHGIPGVVSGILSILFALVYDSQSYGKTLYHIYPYYKDGPMQGNRDNHSQALYQLAGMAIVLTTAIVGGLLTGLILRAKTLNQVDDPVPHGETNYYAQSEFNFLSKYQHAQEQEMQERQRLQQVY